MQVKQASSIRCKPDHQSKLSAPAWAYERQASTLVVGVITNKFQKVLVYIYVQVACAWKWEENAAQKQGDTSLIRGMFTRIYGPTKATKPT